MLSSPSYKAFIGLVIAVLIIVCGVIAFLSPSFSPPPPTTVAMPTHSPQEPQPTATSISTNTPTKVSFERPNPLCIKIDVEDYCFEDADDTTLKISKPVDTSVGLVGSANITPTTDFTCEWELRDGDATATWKSNFSTCEFNFTVSENAQRVFLILRIFDLVRSFEIVVS